MISSRLIFTFLIGFVATTSVLAQVSIAPTNLFINNQQRFGTYLVVNGSAQSQEISIDFVFGYAKTEDTGQRSWIFTDSTVAEQHSVTDYLRAFPQNFILAPGQRQVVRIRVNAPNELDDGTYWARIKTNSSPQTPPIELTSSEAVTARVSMVVEQVTGLFYKNGSVNTGVEVSDIRTERKDENTLDLLIDYNRVGNSPFLGSISSKIIDQNGRTMKEGFVSTSLYFDGTHKFEFDISDVAPGSYTVEVSFVAERSDVTTSDLVPMDPVRVTDSIVISQR